jgi:hypothetical protein
MKLRTPTALLASASMTLLFVAVPSFAQDSQSGHGQPEPPMMGIHWAKGQKPFAKPGGGGSPNMTWHGGDIMVSAVVSTIFWGASWDNPTFAGDKVSGLEAFYGGMGGSGYAGTSDEYSAGNGAVSSAITFAASHVDTASVPKNAGSRTSPILDEVCKVITNPVSNGYYAVYVDKPRGHASFCAWHSAGTCGGTPVQFAFFFNLDGDPGCDPEDGSGLHSQGLAALANVSGHELSEARTDPRLNAWYDSSGAENADKCAWVFGTPLLDFSNRTRWKIQGNWSNAAFNGSTGYPNSSGQLGCLDGGNF